jgi:transposase
VPARTVHNAGGRGGRTIGAKRSILIEYLGLPLEVRVDPAKPHDVRVGRDLLEAHLGDLPLVRDVIADRGYKGLAALAARKHLGLHIKAPPNGSSGFVPLAPLYKVEHAFARLGRWRRLRAATREPRRAPAPGSKSSASPPCSRGCGRSRPDRSCRARACARDAEE